MNIEEFKSLIMDEVYTKDEIGFTDEELQEIYAKDTYSILQTLTVSELESLDSLLEKIDEDLLEKKEVVLEKLNFQKTIKELLEAEVEQSSNVIQDVSDMNEILTYDRIKNSTELLDFTEVSTSMLLKDQIKSIELDYRLSQLDKILEDLSLEKALIEELRNKISEIQASILQILES